MSFYQRDECVQRTILTYDYLPQGFAKSLALKVFWCVSNVHACLHFYYQFYISLGFISTRVSPDVQYSNCLYRIDTCICLN